MKGYVPTPDQLVDIIVERLFFENPPKSTDWLLDPGCADGQFIAGVLRWCREQKIRPPHIVGVELNPALVAKARSRFAQELQVEIVHADYLGVSLDRKFRFVVGNPPYVSLEHIPENARQKYRHSFSSAYGRFDLYFLFFERALSDLRDNGRLALITPEKFSYVDAAGPLREILAKCQIESIEFISENAFDERTTYPTITVVSKAHRSHLTKIGFRDGTSRSVSIPNGSKSWLPLFSGREVSRKGMVSLSECCIRISAGIATGADAIFVREMSDLTYGLERFAHPAIAGRDLSRWDQMAPRPNKAILVPYDQSGRLLPENALGMLGVFLGDKANRARLAERTCSTKKEWYAFHDNCPLADIKRPKILCKDICEVPKFWIDMTGDIIPLHSVYYLVPKSVESIGPLCEWLNGESTKVWLMNHCQRAANGFIRLQSRVIRDLPVPASLSMPPAMKAA